MILIYDLGHAPIIKYLAKGQTLSYELWYYFCVTWVMPPPPIKYTWQAMFPSLMLMLHTTITRQGSRAHNTINNIYKGGISSIGC